MLYSYKNIGKCRVWKSVLNECENIAFENETTTEFSIKRLKIYWRILENLELLIQI